MNQKNLITFLDNAQRTVIGEMLSETATTISIKNPVVVNVVPQYDQQTRQPTGQMALQLLPVFFREFLGDKTAPVVYVYNKSEITSITFDGGFDFRLYGQYDHIFNLSEQGPISQPQPKSDNNPAIKLFDE